MKKTVVSALATAAIVSGACAVTASADTYSVQQGDSLSVIAQKYHTSVVDLKNLNSLSSDLILVNQILQLPSASSQAAAPASTAPTTTAYYTVIKGDTLSKIAQNANIALSDLRQWNNLTGDLIFPGQQLKIAAGTSSNSSNGPAQPAAAQASAATSNYVIQSGDTLSKIANQFNTTVAALMQLNNLSSDLIYAGDTMQVSGTASAASTTVAPASASTSAPAASASGTYVIQSGDTLSKIAAQFNTTVAALMQLNGLSSNLIYAGSSMQVSGTAPATTAAAAPKAVPVSTSAATSTYVVQSGDTLGQIAVQFGTTVSNLKSLNSLTSDMIYVGQQLSVSGQAKPAATTATTSTASSSSSQTPVLSTVTLLAKSMLGKPYVWGGTTPAGFDCSGLIYYIYNKAGYSIGRLTADGYYNRSYEVTNPVPGDLVFFKDTYESGISHVGIYIGNNQFISALNETEGVVISNLNTSYNKAHFDSFKQFY